MLKNELIPMRQRIINYVCRFLKLDIEIAKLKEELQVHKSLHVSLTSRVNDIEKELASNNQININHSYEGPCRVIFLGNLKRGQPFVESYTIPGDYFISIIDEIKARHGKFHHLGHIDSSRSFKENITEVHRYFEPAQELSVKKRIRW